MWDSTQQSVRPVVEGGRLLARPQPAARRPVWPLVAVLLLTLPAVWPLLQPGFFVSDDGLFHLYRIQALADAVRLGDLYPRWFQSFGFGYGQPVLNFYSPLSYYLALPFTLGGPILAAKTVAALGFVLPALAMFLYTRRLWGDAGAILAATVYTYFPYHLADGLLRGALPEHLAFLWPPLILWACYDLFDSGALRPSSERAGRAPTNAGRASTHTGWAGANVGWAGANVGWAGASPAPTALTLTWTGLILTHHLTALMFLPVCLAYLLLLAWRRGAWARLLPAAGALALAGGLTAFYWLPVIAEARFVKLGADPLSTGYRDHLLPLARLVADSFIHVYRPPQVPTEHRLSLLVTILVMVALLAFALRRLVAGQQQGAQPPGRAGAGHVLFFVLITLLCGFLLTATSQPVWDLLAVLLARLQYPWRWLLVCALGSAVAIGALPAALWPRRAWGRRLTAVLLSAAIMISALAALPYAALPIQDRDVSAQQMWVEDAANGQVGATWTAEFLPIAVTEQRWALGRSPAQPQAGPAPAAPPLVTLGPRGPNRYTLTWEAGQAWPVRLHAFYFPGWTVRVDGLPVPTNASGDMGLVTAQVPAGRHEVTIAFENTLPRQLGWVLSSLAWWGGLLWLLLAAGVPGSRGRLAGLTLLVLVPLLLWLGSHLEARWQPTQVTANLENQALLLGADFPATARPGQPFEVTLYWLNLHETATNLTAFVHLVDTAGSVRGQQDGEPVGGFTPTTRWQPGELILDRHTIQLPADLPPGDYTLKAGLYEPNPLRNLTVTPATADNRVTLGPVQITGAP